MKLVKRLIKLKEEIIELISPLIKLITKCYKWCTTNSVKAHIVISATLSQYFWFALIVSPLDEAIIGSLAFCSFFFILKEVLDKFTLQKTGFSFEDLFINYLTWLVVTLVNIAIFVTISNIINFIKWTY